jgi:sugar lactone lactonase YvrE
MRLFFLLVFLTVTFGNISAQPDTFPPLKIGEWRQHLPWQRSKYVTQSDSKVYFATEWAVVEIDKADRSQRFLTKVEGLSDVGMRLIRYNKAADVLVMAYTNSNLDLYHPSNGAVANLPFIKTNINIIGDKQIYDVVFEGKSAYLACGFGVLKLNLEKEEVEYTTFTDMTVRSVALFNGILYAGTEEGVFRIAADDVNPEDFSRWQMLGAAEGFPAGNTVNAMAVWSDKLWLGIEQTLLSYDGSAVDTVTTNPPRTVKYMTAEGAGLLVGWANENNFGLGVVEYLEPNGIRSEIHGSCQAEFPLYGIEDGTKYFWFADQQDEFRYYDHNLYQCEKFSYNSPYLEHSIEIAVGQNGKTYISTPGASPNLGLINFPYGIYIHENGTWRRFYGESNPELKDFDCQFALWRVAPHPTEDKFFAGSYAGGLVEAVPGAEAKCYNKSNSILQSAGPNVSQTSVSGLAFDKDNNLWICNYGAPSPIAVLKSDGTFRNFSGAPANNLLQVAVDQNGYKWFVIGFSGGVLVYDSGQDIDNPADDRYRVITSANSALPNNSVTCIAVDLEGDVWVGTSQGVVSFECGSNVFDPSCTGRRRIVNVDGFNGYLLETENVSTIAVDGANRKWFGTSNGVFVQSPDALTQVARFTDTNSPLFDNAITDIAIDPKTGEAWIGTQRGLLSVRGEATEGGRINSQMPYAYPNPVRPDYDGPIAIYGLARDANVKITDVAGNLFYEGKSLGGQAVWNGRDYLGRRAASGVYIIFATSSETFDAPDAIITKVVILN